MIVNYMTELFYKAVEFIIADLVISINLSNPLCSVLLFVVSLRNKSCLFIEMKIVNKCSALICL